MSRINLVWFARGISRDVDFPPSFGLELAFFALFFSFPFCEALVEGLFPEPETERWGGSGRELALSLLAATACIAEPSTDFPISFGRIIEVGLGIRLFGPLVEPVSSLRTVTFSCLAASGKALIDSFFVVVGLVGCSLLA